MKRYIYLFFMLMCIVSCEKPEEGVMPEKSVNANIVRFRIYQNQNLFFDGTDRKSTRLNSSHYQQSRMPSSA